MNFTFQMNIFCEVLQKSANLPHPWALTFGQQDLPKPQTQQRQHRTEFWACSAVCNMSSVP